MATTHYRKLLLPYAFDKDLWYRESGRIVGVCLWVDCFFGKSIYDTEKYRNLYNHSY